MEKKKLTYKEAVAEMEKILNQIENAEPDMDELQEKVNRVAFLLKFCKEKLYSTEKEVERVMGELDQ
jgi:exodeoxyribonuclease VII small subunit